MLQLISAKDMMKADRKAVIICNTTNGEIFEDEMEDYAEAMRLKLVDEYIELRRRSSKEDQVTMLKYQTPNVKIIYHNAINGGCTVYCGDGRCKNGPLEKYYRECPPLKEIP